MTDDASRFRNLELDDYATGKAAAPTHRSGLSIAPRPSTRPLPRLPREAHWLSNTTLRDFQQKVQQNRQNEAIRQEYLLGLLLSIGLVLGALALFLGIHLAPQTIALSKHRVTTIRKNAAAAHSRSHSHHRRKTKR